MRLGELVRLVFTGIDAARRHGVQKRLPEVGAGTFDRGDRRSPPPAKPITETGDQLQSCAAAADHDYAVQCLHTGGWHLCSLDRRAYPSSSSQDRRDDLEPPTLIHSA
jgi:hypothetical protein